MEGFLSYNDFSSNSRDLALHTDSHVALQASASVDNQMEPVQNDPEQDTWEFHRPTIKKLYLDDDKPLKEVMAIMQRDHAHKGTVKMYKNRITKWRLDKNAKAHEMKAIARKKVERDAVGKASTFEIRGRQVEIEAVLRYFKRRHYRSFMDVVNRDKSPQAATPSDVRCLTPDISFLSDSTGSSRLESASSMAAADEEAIRSQTFPSQTTGMSGTDMHHPLPGSDLAKSQLLWWYDDIRRLSTLNHVSPSLTQPQSLLIPERMFSTTRTILQGVFDGSLWKTDSDGNQVSQKEAAERGVGRSAIAELLDCCLIATFFLDQKLFVEARQLLSKACERIKDVLEEGHLRTIPIILEIQIEFEFTGYRAAAVMVFEHFRAIAAVTPGVPHAFRQFFENILLLDQDVVEVLFLTRKLNEDILDQHLEPFNRTRLVSRIEYLDVLCSKGSWRETEQCLRSLLTDCEQKYGRLDQRYWLIQDRLAMNLQYQGRDEEVEEMGHNMVQQARYCMDEKTFPYLAIRALDIVSTAQYKQSKYDLAHESLMLCISIATKSNGENDPATIHYSLKLEEWLLGWGRQEEAAVLATERSRILGSPQIEELME